MELADIRSVLAVVAHPDDIEAFCAGTFAFLRERGARVAYLHLTSGDKGSDDPQMEPQRLAAMREAEQRAAAQLLGIADLIFFRIPDGSVTDDLPTRAAIAAQIRRIRPDLIVTFDPWHHYTFHNDHRQAGLVAIAAARTLARQPGPANDAEGNPLEPAAPGHAARAAWHFHTDRPTRAVDVSTVIDRKVAARLAHASQARNPDATARNLRERAATLGEPHGLAYAEVFHEADFPADETIAARLAARED
jgi:LmbE family N-acetylglucosaminyl deacetylase